MLYFLIGLIDQVPAGIFITIVFAYFLAICVAMSFHEFAHSLTAYKCGDPTPKAFGRLTLNPFAHFSGWGLLMFFLLGFGWAKPVKINPNNFRHFKKGMVLVSLSGVLTNLILAFVFSGLYVLTSVLGADLLANDNVFIIFFAYFFQFGIILNLVLCIFNLLPIYPLDGFNFLSTFLRYDNKFVQFMYKYGFIILLIAILPFFAGNSILGYFYNYVIGWISSGFFAFWGLFY